MSTGNPIRGATAAAPDLAAMRDPPRGSPFTLIGLAGDVFRLNQVKRAPSTCDSC